MKVICTNYRECAKDINITKRNCKHVKPHDYDPDNECPMNYCRTAVIDSTCANVRKIKLEEINGYVTNLPKK